MRRRVLYALTLIELLIVVAIIAILTAIAVPNFLEAQVRSMVSQAKSDVRATALALEEYRVDYYNYPYNQFAIAAITTPVACISGLMNDVFFPRTVTPL